MAQKLNEKQLDYFNSNSGLFSGTFGYQRHYCTVTQRKRFPLLKLCPQSSPRQPIAIPQNHSRKFKCPGARVIFPCHCLIYISCSIIQHRTGKNSLAVNAPSHILSDQSIIGSRQIPGLSPAKPSSAQSKDHSDHPQIFFPLLPPSDLVLHCLIHLYLKLPTADLTSKNLQVRSNQFHLRLIALHLQQIISSHTSACSDIPPPPASIANPASAVTSPDQITINCLRLSTHHCTHSTPLTTPSTAEEPVSRPRKQSLIESLLLSDIPPI